MGREIKRVALDFNWPLGMVWDGYITEDDEGYDPPAGDGWQVWETVSEGSPLSPVLATREALVEWLMSPAYNWGISRPLTREQAERFTELEWAPTFMTTAGGAIVPGDQSTYLKASEPDIEG